MRSERIILGIILIIIAMFFAFAPIFAAPFIGSFSIFQGMMLAPGSGYEYMLLPFFLLGMASIGTIVYECT